MADKKVRLLNQAGDELYPRTTMDNILEAPGSTVYANLVKLNGLGKIDATYLPSYVDDVLELLTMSDTAPASCATGDMYFNTTSKKIFTATGTDTWGETGTDPEKGVIYVDLSTDKIYRWSGSIMSEISQQVTTVTSVGPASGEGAATNSEVPTALAVRQAITDAEYELPAAGYSGTATSLGGIYVGDNLNVTAGGVLSIADASTSSKGVIQLATDAEASSGTDAVKAITPSSLKTVLSGYEPVITSTVHADITGGTLTVTEATDSTKGVVELATSSETLTGTDTTRAVTPAGVKAVADTKQDLITSTVNATISGGTLTVATGGTSTKGVVAIDTTADDGVALAVSDGTVSVTAVQGTTAAVGTVRLATTTEASTGTSEQIAVTPLGMSTVLSGFQPLLSSQTNITVSGNSISVADATSTTKGVAAFSTGTSNGLTVGVNAATVSVSVATASTAGYGTVQLATNAEASSGTDTSKAVTPAGLNAALLMGVFYEPLT